MRYLLSGSRLLFRSTSPSIQMRNMCPPCKDNINHLFTLCITILNNHLICWKGGINGKSWRFCPKTVYAAQLPHYPKNPPPTSPNHHHLQLQNFPDLPHRQNYRFHSPAAKSKNFAFLPKISFPQPIHSNITQKLITLNNNSQKVIHNHSRGINFNQ